MKKNSVVKITNDIEGSVDLKQRLTFLLEDEKLEKINKSVSRFNPFRVLKLEHYEIRHSNFLAWLLNPQESHDLDDVFLKKFLEKINENNDTIISTETINKDNITIAEIRNVFPFPLKIFNVIITNNNNGKIMVLLLLPIFKKQKIIIRIYENNTLCRCPLGFQDVKASYQGTGKREKK